MSAAIIDTLEQITNHLRVQNNLPAPNHNSIIFRKLFHLSLSNHENFRSSQKVLDLNKDGKVDIEDFKFAHQKVRFPP
jgi:hypothetical protein